MDKVDFRIKYASLLLEKIEQTPEPEKSALVMKLAAYRIQWSKEDEGQKALNSLRGFANQT